MTGHNHTEFVPGCYRCDLNLDELPTPLEAAIAADEAYMDDHNGTVDGDSEERVLETLTAALDAANITKVILDEWPARTKVLGKPEDHAAAFAAVIRKKILGEEA